MKGENRFMQLQDAYVRNRFLVLAPEVHPELSPYVPDMPMRMVFVGYCFWIQRQREKAIEPLFPGGALDIFAQLPRHSRSAFGTAPALAIQPLVYELLFSRFCL